MADDYAGSTATTGEVSAGGAPVFGRIETADDSDWFAVTLVAGQAYEFRLLTTSSGGLTDPYLELYDPSGSFITFDDDGGGGLTSLISFTPTTSGTYYLAAWGAQSSDLGHYALVVDDHGDGPAGAGRITVGTPEDGGIEVADDIDWYAVTLVAGTQYTIELKGAPSGKGTLEDPFFNGIYDAGGNYLQGTVNDDFGSSAESRVVFTPTTSGTYYLAAAGYDGSDTGTYRLSINGQAAPDLSATTGTTATLALGGTLRSSIGTGSDVDWVKVTLTANQTVVVQLDGDDNTFNPLADPRLVGIYDSAGVLVPGTANDDYGIGLNARTTFTPSTSGTYYLAAGSAGGETGAYALSLLSAAAATDSVGQTPGSAAALTVGTPLGSAVNAARDVDWFKVTLSAGQNLVIDVRGVASGAGSLGDPELLGVYDAAGTIIPGTGNDDSNGTLDAQDFFRPVSSGVYYVAVGAADDGVGTYTVSVQTAPSSSDLPDNATTSASLSVGGTLGSQIGAPGDVDWVEVTLSAGQTYTIADVGSPSGNLTLADPQILGVYDALGRALAQSADDDSGPGSSALVTITAPVSGTFYIAAGAFGDATGSYQLQLNTASPDTAAPRLLSTSPADNAGSVAVGSNLTIEFSEAVKAGSGSIVITGGGSTQTISVRDADQVSFSGNLVTINPDANLKPGVDYAVTFGDGVVKDLAGNDFAGISSSSTFNFKTATGSTGDSWTVMVYMAADNDLERFAVADLNEMESVALPGNVNVVTLLDRAAGYDSSNGNWTNTRSGVVSADGSLTSIGSDLKSIGEVNTGSAQTLTDFINASVASRPADNYALIIWDHGGGLSGTAWDDGSNGDNLTVREMQEGVDASVVGKFDFIGFDACLQGMLEQAWELRGLADVVVGSQELEPGDGWEYQDILARLAASPNMTAYDLADAVVDAFGTRYAGESDITLSATKTGALAGLRSALDAFIEAALTAGSGLIPALKNAAARATEFDSAGRHDYRDLGDFLREVGAAVGDARVKDAAADALDALHMAVLTSVGSVAGANGLSVYLPLDRMADSYVTQEFEFLQSTSWGNFLRFLTNDSGADNLGGDGLDNDIRGFGGNDTLSGGGGRDRLDGGAGSDRMVGGDGSDSYFVGSSGDVVVETNSSSAGGVDTVFSALSGYTLGDHVENGRIDTEGAANLSGNSLKNLLIAGAGSNVLNGDTGVDTVDYRLATSGVTVGLDTVSTQATGGSGADTLISIENLTGSDFTDELTGSNGKNLLSGGAGNDTLSGGSGQDSFRFSSALNGSNVDRILDFSVADDTLQLENSVFTQLTTTGTLAATHFRANASGNASDANDFIVYETDTGKLFFDADGDGPGAKLLVAQLSGNPVLTAADVFVT